MKRTEASTKTECSEKDLHPTLKKEEEEEEDEEGEEEEEEEEEGGGEGFDSLLLGN